MPKSESRQHARRHYSAGLKPITRLLAWTPLHASRTAIPVLMPVYRPLSIGRRSRVNIRTSTTNAKDYIIDSYLPINSYLIARVDSFPIHPLLLFFFFCFTFCFIFFPFFFVYILPPTFLFYFIFHFASLIYREMVIVGNINFCLFLLHIPFVYKSPWDMSRRMNIYQGLSINNRFYYRFRFDIKSSLSIIYIILLFLIIKKYEMNYILRFITICILSIIKINKRDLEMSKKNYRSPFRKTYKYFFLNQRIYSLSILLKQVWLNVIYETSTMLLIIVYVT